MCMFMFASMMNHSSQMRALPPTGTACRLSSNALSVALQRVA